jgi:hypothetical protein
MSKLQEKPSALKREHPALQIKFINFFSMSVGHFSPLGSGSGLRIQIRIRIKDTIEARSNPVPDLQHCL